jgi:TonB family protein
MSADHEDAQTVLERKALRNVRALVERMERDESRRYRGLGRELAAATLLIVAFIMAFALYHRWFGPAHEPAHESAPRSPKYPLAPTEVHRVFFEKTLAARKRLGVPSELAGKRGTVKLEAIIRPDGSLGLLDVVSSSGDRTLDAYAVKVVVSAAPFGPLPASVIGKNESMSIPLAIQFSPEN